MCCTYQYLIEYILNIHKLHIVICLYCEPTSKCQSPHYLFDICNDFLSQCCVYYKIDL